LLGQGHEAAGIADPAAAAKARQPNGESEQHDEYPKMIDGKVVQDREAGLFPRTINGRQVNPKVFLPLLGRVLPLQIRQSAPRCWRTINNSDFIGFLFPTAHRIGTPKGWNPCPNIRGSRSAVQFATSV